MDVLCQNQMKKDIINTSFLNEEGLSYVINQYFRNCQNSYLRGIDNFLKDVQDAFFVPFLSNRTDDKNKVSFLKEKLQTLDFSNLFRYFKIEEKLTSLEEKYKNNPTLKYRISEIHWQQKDIKKTLEQLEKDKTFLLTSDYESTFQTNKTLWLKLYASVSVLENQYAMQNKRILNFLRVNWNTVL